MDLLEMYQINVPKGVYPPLGTFYKGGGCLTLPRLNIWIFHIIKPRDKFHHPLYWVKFLGWGYPLKIPFSVSFSILRGADQVVSGNTRRIVCV